MLKVFVCKKTEVRIADTLPKAVSERINGYRNTDRRNDSLLAYSVLMRALKDGGFGREAETLHFSEKGKPMLLGNVFVSVSHTDGAIAVAVSDSEVGVDLERIRKVDDRTFLSVVGTGKYNLQSMSETRKQEVFFAEWTAKESYTKLTGEGMSLNPNTLSLDKNEDGGFSINGVPINIIAEDGCVLAIANKEAYEYRALTTLETQEEEADN